MLLDNYDQFNFKKLNLHKIISKKYKAMQIIVTTRPDYATELELSNAFGQYDKIYISPFNRDQKINFITKTLEFFNQNKE